MKKPSLLSLIAAFACVALYAPKPPITGSEKFRPKNSA